MTLSRIVDEVLDRTVIPGFGRFGILARQALPDWPPDPGPLEGKVALVTGGTSGIGLAAARGLAGLGARVVITGRDRQRVDEAAAGLGGSAEGRACDVSSLVELEGFIKDWTGPLDVLVNNAGLMVAQRESTPEGLELTFATNVLGPWCLIDGLRGHMPRGARIINVTSGGMYTQRLVSDPEEAAEPYAAAVVYARSKRSLMVITELWADRLRADGITVNAMHPGWVDTPGVGAAMPLFATLTAPILRSPEQGADTIVWLAGSSELSATGRLWMDRRERPTVLTPWTSDRDGDRRRLWATCERLAAGTPDVSGRAE